MKGPNQAFLGEASASLDNPSTIYQWTSQGFIPQRKVRQLVQFSEDNVRKLLSKMKTGGRKNRKYDVRDLGF